MKLLTHVLRIQTIYRRTKSIALYSEKKVVATRNLKTNSTSIIVKL